MKYKFVFLFALVLFACKQKTDRSSTKDQSFVENGVVKKYDEQNRLSAEITYQNGVRNGVTRYYYSSGALSDEIMYVDDEKSGVAKKYHKNGNIYSLTPYLKDEKDGIQKKYYANGKIWAETPYMRGQPGIGLKEYKRDGSLRENYPDIEVQMLEKSDRIILKLFLSNYSKNVVFYITELMKNKYIPPAAKPIYAEGGVGRYEFMLDSQSNLDTTLNIVAKYQTKDYNINVSTRELVLKN
ncbi:toxin-antitoxin system YwqK family antitoxin [Marinifilum sp. D714]|uniref:toxin-antitoxin system YwqK family antitoxin n=1 Tax=Marinifilum sp. D714 TaxID=2937523 RepID=UPI0027BF9C2A|nr:hypothetical protein [Marinifilum sp. D714]MDQ2180335.1 hypothetical protein [Marinifilum sp. D714]